MERQRKQNVAIKKLLEKKLADELNFDFEKPEVKTEVLVQKATNTLKKDQGPT